MADQTISAAAADWAEQDGLLFAVQLDGKGGATRKGWQDVEEWRDGDAPIWAHFEQNSERVQRWLREKSGLTLITCDALLATETRPRVFFGKKGTIAILRGVNMNPGAEPEDMVAMRLWSDGKRLISVRFQRLMTPRDILTQLVDNETGPKTVPELYERLIGRLTERMAGVVGGYDEQLDSIEANVDTGEDDDARGRLSELRRQSVLLRRYMSPQREALNHLLQEPPPWFDEQSRMRLRETSDQMQRYIEDLDAVRERCIVLKDDIANRLAEKLNQNLYVLSIIAAIFLPLGFATGLLGINVGGMPGVDSSAAFWITCAMMVVILIIELIIFRKLKWL